MNSINYWLTKEEAEEINEEIRFVSGKTGIPEERATEIMKIGLLTRILDRLEDRAERKGRKQNGNIMDQG